MVNPDVFPLAKIYAILIEAGQRGKQKAPETGLVGNDVVRLLGATEQEENCNDRRKCTTRERQ